MTDAQQREAARQFYYKWNGKGREDEDARSYRIDVLVNILGMEKVTDQDKLASTVLLDAKLLNSIQPHERVTAQNVA